MSSYKQHKQLCENILFYIFLSSLAEVKKRVSNNFHENSFVVVVFVLKSIL